MSFDADGIGVRVLSIVFASSFPHADSCPQRRGRSNGDSKSPAVTCPSDITQTGDLVHRLHSKALTTQSLSTDGASCVAVGRVASSDSGVTMGGTAVQRGHRQYSTPRTGRYSTATFVPLVVVGTFLAACSGDSGLAVETPAHRENPSASPSFTGPPSMSLPSPVDDVAATKVQVQERYERYHEVVAEVGAVSDPDDPRLADYATGGVLANLRGTLALRRADGRRLYGRAAPHVSAVTITGDQATVQDCLDNSATGLMDPAGTRLNVGRAQQQTTATLTQEAGVWKVSELTTVEGGGGC